MGWEEVEGKGGGGADNKTDIRTKYLHIHTQSHACIHPLSYTYILLGTVDDEQTTSMPTHPRRRKVPAADQPSNSSSSAGKCVCVVLFVSLLFEY